MKLGEVNTQMLTFVMLDVFMYYTLPQFLSNSFKIFQLLACIYKQRLTSQLILFYIAVIYLQIWAYESWDSLLPISMSPTANLWVHNTIFHDKSAIVLHLGTRWNKNFASQRQTYAQKMQDAQVKKSLHCFKTGYIKCLISWKRVNWLKQNN